MSSKIQWTNETWNVVTGCTKVSEGCRHCYAERVLPRTGQPFDQVLLHPDRLEKPKHWRSPRRIFVNSLSDLFHEDIPDEFLDQVFAVMADTPQHTYQILTKRHERMLSYLSPDNPRYTASKVFDLTKGPAGKFDCDLYWPLDNVWLGHSVENQETADLRIPFLLKTPAAVRFISYEPALGPVDFWGARYQLPTGGKGSAFAWGTGVQWVIIGGESGPGARPFDLAWARSVIQECQAADCAVFMKQLGANPVDTSPLPIDPAATTAQQEILNVVNQHAVERALGRITDNKGGEIEEWPEDLRVREFPR